MKSIFKKNIIKGLMILLVGAGLTACNSFEFPVDLSFSRLFSPVSFDATNLTATGVTLTFSKVSNAQKYVIEFSEDSLQFGTIVRTHEVSIDTLKLVDGTTNKYNVPETNLKGGTRYSARIKSATNDGSTAESKYDMVTFQTKTEQIFKGIIPTEKTDVSVVLHWDATGANITHIVLVSAADGSSKTITLTDAQKTAAQALIDGLAGSTTYTASIYNETNKRGEITFRTNESVPSAGTVVRLVGGEDLIAVMKDLSGSVTLVLPMGSVYAPSWLDPTTSTTVFSLPINDNITSLTIWGTEGGVQPKLNCTTMKIGAAVTSLKLKNIEYTGNSSASDYLINESATRALSTVTFDNCNIHTVRGVLRLQNDANYTVLDKVTFSGCIIRDIGSYGVTNTGAANVKLNNLEIRETTLYNMTDALGNFKNVAASILIDQCTFYNCFGNGKYIFNFNTSFLPTSLSINKCIFGKINALVDGTQTMRATSPKISTTFVWDSYRTTDCFINTGYPLTGVTDYAKTSADLFTDPANANFKLKDLSFGGLTTAGDPRWR